MSERTYVLFGIICFIIGILISIYTTIGNGLSVRGKELQELYDKIGQIKRDNVALEEQLLYEEAFTTIDQKAREEGFTDAPNITFLNGRQFVMY